MKKTALVEGSSIIIGTVIGAGILGLPFVFRQAGFWTGVVLLLIISTLVIILSLFLGEVTLRTKGNHQLTGYTEKYLGKGFKHLQAIVLLFGMYSALLAYMIGQGEILADIFGGPKIMWSLIFYVILGFLVIKGLGVIKRIEFIIGLLLLGFIFVLAVIATPHIEISYWTKFDWTKFFIPYGAILFACSGLVSIPEAREIIGATKGEKKFPLVIIIGNLVPTIIYLSFAALVLSVTGANTTEIATLGLTHTIGLSALIFGSLFSIIAMSSSFMTLGVAIKTIFQYDYKIKPLWAIVATLSVPLIFFLLGIRDFFGVVSISGALSVGLTGLISLITFWEARKKGERKPEYVVPRWLAIPATVVIAAMFLLGFIYTL